MSKISLSLPLPLPLCVFVCLWYLLKSVMVRRSSLSRTQAGGPKTPSLTPGIQLSHSEQESGLSGRSAWSQWGPFSEPWKTKAFRERPDSCWTQRLQCGNLDWGTNGGIEWYPGLLAPSVLPGGHCLLRPYCQRPEQKPSSRLWGVERSQSSADLS